MTAIHAVISGPYRNGPECFCNASTGGQVHQDDSCHTYLALPHIGFPSSSGFILRYWFLHIELCVVKEPICDLLYPHITSRSLGSSDWGLLVVSRMKNKRGSCC